MAEAPKWAHDDIVLRKAKLEALGQLYEAIGSYNFTHPWWGFTPQPLAPGDNDSIGRIIKEALSLTEKFIETVLNYQDKTEDDEEPTIVTLEHLHKAFQALPEPPANLKGDILPRVFGASDPHGTHNRDFLSNVIHNIESARELNKQADAQLVPNCDLDFDNAEPIVAKCSNDFALPLFSVPLNILEETVFATESVLNKFKHIVSHTPCAFLPIQVATLESLDSKIESTKPLTLQNQTIHEIKDGASTLLQEIARLEHSFKRISSIATRRGIDFDGSPRAITRLSQPDGIEEVLPGVLVDNTVIAKAQKTAEYLLSEVTIAEIDKRQQELYTLHSRIAQALDEIRYYSQQLSLHFDDSQKALAQLVTLSQIASWAPLDLLDYRHPSIAHPRTLKLIEVAEMVLASEKSQREHLGQEFYLDDLPDTKELKDAIRVFRRGESFFNIFNSEWRAAKKLFNGICKKKTKRKAAECEALVSNIVSWIEHRASFIGNNEFKDVFGQLFEGLDTDFSKIRSLHTWYIESRTEMLRHPGFIESVDLTALDSDKIHQFTALSPRLQNIFSTLESCSSKVKQLLGPASKQLDLSLLHSGWNTYNQKVLQVADGLKNISSFLGRYVKKDVSPGRAVEVLYAKLEIHSTSSDFEALNHGLDKLNKVVEPLLPGIGSIPCLQWSKYLPYVSSLAHATKRLAEYVSNYGSGEETLSDIRSFFEAKLALDANLEKLAVLPEKNTIQDWPTYIYSSTQHIKAVSRLVQILKPAGKVGKSAEEVVIGLTARNDANNLISGIANDDASAAMLQGLFQGIETDLDSLVSTISWSETVIDCKPIHNSSLNSLLLSPKAIQNFYWIKATLQQIIDLSEGIKRKLGELAKFGSFSWDAWNSAGHKQAKCCLASSLRERIGAAAYNIDSVLPWSKYNAERIDCKKIGLGDFVVGLEQMKLPPASIGSVFEFVVYRSVGRSIYKRFPELEGFAGTTHEKKRAEYSALDMEIINLNGRNFAYEIDQAKRIPRGNSGSRVADYTEMRLLQHMIAHPKSRVAIRQLMKRAGRTVQALKPCFMMGPMSVAQYLEQGAIEFDVVVMDEASQLRPEETMGVIARGKQLVVVGDQKQLPPTNFFNRMLDSGDDEDDDTPAVLAGSESILDICQQLFHPIRTLLWHYRSQHESLIAFSNHHFYNGKLVVFPSPFDRNNRLGLRYRYIKNGVYKDRQNVPEASRVVDAIIESMMKYPDESLGVVTLNQTQRDLIEDLLDKKLRSIEEAHSFISTWEQKGWPFFVKNLENVQGDERDIIFISTTFGKAPGIDKPRQNFGPISRPDGWRRLNVLFTRARRKIELFTSMQPEDIVLEAKTPAGTRALKDYLDFAKRGVLTSTNISDRDPDSDFEIAVGDMLRNRGYEVVPQLGVAGFFIDLAVRNPDRPGEFLAAVECDGATYHSSNSARDRDRIRQTILESLGWKDRIWRIWSTDWFFDPHRESERLLTFLKERRATVRSAIATDYDFEEEFEVIEKAKEMTLAEVADAATDPTLSISEEELYVEVGDRITYCFDDKPEERHSVMIVDTESNPRFNLINEDAPLAKALLNLAAGEESELEVKGSPTRGIRVLHIHRQNGTIEIS